MGRALATRALTTANLNSWNGARSARLAAQTGTDPGNRLPGREAECFGMGPAVVLGQDLAEAARPVGNGLTADLAACYRKMGHGHRETAGT